ncbi:hypothetical protein SAMN05421539_10442 [Jannaschia seohaensis]|uniref:Uncharacterized protein n=1 Tax=Jannaschia seohaensis TaxID=475081 RepID=A0A2Y9AMZ0_9RHOB|nr:hypothetical protein BCF38_10442 [Jannaschia seohaensis]SSA45750.1 hypothetical protein SAMN05421539_10442 [Jannaschia seohaensis]
MTVARPEERLGGRVTMNRGNRRAYLPEDLYIQVGAR